jgi:hypothetical protein
MGNDFACAHAPLMEPADPRLAHQPLDALAAEVLAVAQDQLHMDARGSVDATMAGVDLHSDTAT